MQFLYVFALIFLLIFGFAMLIHLLAKALLDGSTRRYDIYVKGDENIAEFLKNARDSSFIGEVYIIEKGMCDESDKFVQ
ncbi:MAG: hypothetical protein HDT42_01525 [Ruminococcaceae bacterium]|nr:hypothetical protein [Oscillospiraceae bacterium]